MNTSQNTRSDEIELLLGNTHRCRKCSKAFEQNREGPDVCPECGSAEIAYLHGLEKCLVNTNIEN